jgi:hypothetical protein
LERQAENAQLQIKLATEAKLEAQHHLMQLKSANAAEEDIATLEQRIQSDEHSFTKQLHELKISSRASANAGESTFRDLYERSEARLADQLERNKRMEESHLAEVMRIQQQFDSTRQQLLESFHTTLEKVSEENRLLAEKGLTRSVQAQLQKQQALQDEVDASRSAARKVLLHLHKVERMYTRVMLETSLWKDKCHLLETRVIAVKRHAAGKPPLSQETKDHVRSLQQKGSLTHPQMAPLAQTEHERAARTSLNKFAQLKDSDYKQIDAESRNRERESGQGLSTNLLLRNETKTSPKRRGLAPKPTTTITKSAQPPSFGIAQKLADTIQEARSATFHTYDAKANVVARLLAQTSDMIGGAGDSQDAWKQNLATSLDSPLKHQSSAKSMEQFTSFAAAHVAAAKSSDLRAGIMETTMRHAPRDTALALLQSSRAAADNALQHQITHTTPSRGSSGQRGFISVDTMAAGTYLPAAMEFGVQRAAVTLQKDYIRDAFLKTRGRRPASAAPRAQVVVPLNIVPDVVLPAGQGKPQQRRPVSACPAHNKSRSRPKGQPARWPEMSPGSAVYPEHDSSKMNVYGSSLKGTVRTSSGGQRTSGAFEFMLHGQEKPPPSSFGGRNCDMAAGH